MQMSTSEIRKPWLQMARNPNGWDRQYCSPFPSRDLDSLRSCCTNSVSNEHSSSYAKDCHLVFILPSKGLQCCTRFDRPVNGLQPRCKFQKRTTQMLESFFTKWPIFATQHTPPAPLNVGPSSIARCVHHCSRTRHWSFLAKIIGMLISGIAASLWTRNLRSHRISKAPTKDRFCFLPRPSHTRLNQTISPSLPLLFRMHVGRVITEHMQLNSRQPAKLHPLFIWSLD